MNLFIKAHFKVARLSHIILFIYFGWSVLLDMQVSNIIMGTHNLIFKLIVIYLIVYLEISL